jgi:hypothetical protein
MLYWMPAPEGEVTSIVPVGMVQVGGLVTLTTGAVRIEGCEIKRTELLIHPKLSFILKECVPPDIVKLLVLLYGPESIEKL